MKLAHTVRLCLCLSALTSASLPALAQEPGPDVAGPSEEDLIAELLEELIGAIGDDGIRPFDGLAYPLVVLRGGDEPGLQVYGSPRDHIPTRTADLMLSQMKLRPLGRVALAQILFGPTAEPDLRATAFVVLCRPVDRWQVQALCFAPMAPPADSDIVSEGLRIERDAVAAVAIEFARSITSLGFSEFEGLVPPFVAFDGATGLCQVFTDSSDLPQRGTPLPVSATRTRVNMLYGLAEVSFVVSGGEALAEVGLVCLRGPSRWHIALVLVGPPMEEPQPEARRTDRG